MRRRRAEKRDIAPDPKYGREDVARFINKIMFNGKKSLAERTVYRALDLASERTQKDPLEVFSQALKNATPMLRVKPRRVGGATYQVPIEVPPDTARALAMRWLIQAARARAGRPIVEKLASEFIDASQGQGTAVKRREDTHRMAEANRAFVHYRW